MRRLELIENHDNRLEAWVEGTGVCITIGDSVECSADIKLTCEFTNELLAWLLSAQIEQHTLTVPPQFKVAEGDQVCGGCAGLYSDHREHDSFPWLTKLCGERWVKLVRSAS